MELLLVEPDFVPEGLEVGLELSRQVGVFVVTVAEEDAAAHR
jgi:hypothetical protein